MNGGRLKQFFIPVHSLGLADSASRDDYSDLLFVCTESTAQVKIAKLCGKMRYLCRATSSSPNATLHELKQLVQRKSRSDQESWPEFAESADGSQLVEMGEEEEVQIPHLEEWPLLDVYEGDGEALALTTNFWDDSWYHDCQQHGPADNIQPRKLSYDEEGGIRGGAYKCSL